jgi:hypothetical protein
MLKNMGSADKVIRLTVSILLVILVIADIITGTWAIVALIAAGILIITSLVGFCPIYYPFGIKTIKLKN